MSCSENTKHWHEWVCSVAFSFHFTSQARTASTTACVSSHRALQGGTCVMMGDDHGRIAAASKLAAKQIGCRVFRGSPYYRKEGMACPLQLILSTFPALQCFSISEKFPFSDKCQHQAADGSRKCP